MQCYNTQSQLFSCEVEIYQKLKGCRLTQKQADLYACFDYAKIMFVSPLLARMFKVTFPPKQFFFLGGGGGGSETFYV